MQMINLTSENVATGIMAIIIVYFAYRLFFPRKR